MLGFKGGNVELRGQQSDTPDQSAARGTTLELMFRRAIKTGEESAGGKKGGNEGGAGNPDQSAARKTRHNTRRVQETKREQGREEEQEN